jgi:hypothetical protein
MPVDSGSGISPTPETVGNHLYLPLNIESMERKKVGGRQMDYSRTTMPVGAITV